MEFNVNIFVSALLAVLISNVSSQDYGRQRLPGPGSRRCRWGSAGVCGGFVGAACPTGSSCRFVWSTQTAGLCCWDLPKPVDICKGRPASGNCGGFVGEPCESGYTCVYPEGSTLGTCCEDRQKPVDICKGRLRGGSCGGFVGKPCKSGYECIYPTGSSLGQCCQRAKGTCPPSSGRPGICVFDPAVNCLSDEFCGNDKLCCPEGCGRVCKNPVYL